MRPEPTRTCVGCRGKRPQGDLVRVVRATDGSLLIGRTLAGRGAWLCAGSHDCLELAVKRRAFERALRAAVGDAAMTTLRQDFVRQFPAARG